MYWTTTIGGVCKQRFECFCKSGLFELRSVILHCMGSSHDIDLPYQSLNTYYINAVSLCCALYRVGIKAFTCGVPLQRKATPLLSEIENKLMCAYFDSCFLALKATASDRNTGIYTPIPATRVCASIQLSN